jgi:hypothetical protein
MFKLNPNPTFECAVPLSVAGIPEPVDLRVTFKHKNKTALSAWMKDAGSKDDTTLLAEVLTGWVGMKDDKGEDVPFSTTALRDLLENYPAAHGEIFKTYLRELTEAKRKN